MASGKAAWALGKVLMTAPPWAGQREREIKETAQISFQRSLGCGGQGAKGDCGGMGKLVGGAGD